MLQALFFAFVLIVALGSGEAGAANPDRARSQVAEGRKALAAGDAKTAVIQLRNAVQNDPASGEARYVLAMAFSKLTDWTNAEQNLRAAAERNFDPPVVDAALGDVLMAQGKYGDILEDLMPGDRPPELEGKVRIARGYAYYGLRRPDEAIKEFQSAIAQMSNPALAQSGLAQVRLVTGDVPGAAELLEKAVVNDPTIADAWLLLGKVREWRDDIPGALKALGKAIELAPRSEPARRARAVLLADTDEATAQADVNIILEDDPANATGNMIDAGMKMRRGRWRDAELALQGIASIESNPPALYLLTMVNLAQGQVGQADENITRYLAKAPNDPKGKGLKARVLLARGNAAAAIDLLKSATAAAPNDAQILGLLGDAYARAGQAAEAAAVFEKLTKMLADNPDASARISAKRLLVGKADEAIADLERIRDLGALSTGARSFLIVAYLRNNEIDKAVAAAEELRKDAPTSPLPELALGLIALKREGPAAGRMHFMNALKIQPDFTDAEINVGQTYRVEKRYDEARGTFERILKRLPNNGEILLALADIAAADKKPDEVVTWLERARAAEPTNVQARLRLVDAYIIKKDFNKALALAREAEGIAPREPFVIGALADAQLAKGDSLTALTTYRRLVEVTAESPGALLSLANALHTTGDLQGARQTLQRAVELNPGDRGLHRTLFDYVVANRSVGPALPFVKDLANRRAGDAWLDLLYGDLLQADKRYREAMTAYSNGLAKQENGIFVVRRAKAQFLAQEGGAAINSLRAWLARHADDREARFALSGMLTETGEELAAARELETLLSLQQDDVVVLNNLAWIYASTGDPRALDRAQRAYLLAPNSPAVADTLGWIFLRKGDVERAISLLQGAAALPNSPPTAKYHLAVALDRANRRADARAVLESLLRDDKKFAEAAEARALLTRLQK